ncbi:sulfite exporter TauE/SafE [Aureococcus anophagefferens]|nr:sulfite exporter TauE/SafE [Aureococcus anophagefferens]
MAQRRHPVDDVMHVREPTDCKAFCLKYFCEGQRLEASLEEKLQADKVEWTVKYRKQRAPASVGQMRKYRDPNGTPPVDLLRGDVRPWYMSVTMVFGSMVAGMTSEGGASVAFPVMTLAMDVKPHVAKQFSYMIQSVGMTAAAFVILYMQIAPVLTPPYAMYFVVIWGSFAASLYYLNRIHGRKVYLVLDPKHIPEIWKSADLTPYWWANLVLNWKALVLLAAGFIGGIFTSFAGSGIDICSFSVLTLLFRVSEKTATPTSVVLMAINTVIAMCYCKWMMREGLEALAWDFFAVCAPIVVVGAPLGSVVGSHVHRLVLATCVYVTDFVQLVGALIVVRPWTHRKCHKDGPRVQHGSAGRWRGTNCEPVHLCWTSAVLFASGLVAFYIFQLVGEKLMERNARIEKEVLGDPDDVEKAAEAPAVAAVVGAEPAEGAFLKES